MTQAGATEIRADPGCFSLRLPLVLLGAVIVGCFTLAVLTQTGLQSLWHLDPPQRYLGPLVFVVPAFCYVRWVYVPRTMLTLGETGLALHQPLARWDVAYDDIATITVRSALNVGYRNGVNAGVRLRLRDGTVRHVPDVFGVRRGALAKLIDERRAAGSEGRPARAG